MIPSLFAGRQDRKHMAAMQQASRAGKPYRFTAKSKKLKHPSTNEPIPKGSVVQSRTATTSKKSGLNPFTITHTAQPGKSTMKSTYIPGDKSKSSGEVTDRSTTMALGKAHNENPAKTAMRMKAQSEGATTYQTPKGKTEYAGRKHNVFTISTPSVTKGISTKTDPVQLGSSKTSVQVIKPLNSQKGPLKKGTASPLPWISGTKQGAQKDVSRYGAKKKYSFKYRAKKNLGA